MITHEKHKLFKHTAPNHNFTFAIYLAFNHWPPQHTCACLFLFFLPILIIYLFIFTSQISTKPLHCQYFCSLSNFLSFHSCIGTVSKGAFELISSRFLSTSVFESASSLSTFNQSKMKFPSARSLCLLTCAGSHGLS